MAGLLKEIADMSNVYRNPDVMWREEDDSRVQAYEGLEKGENVEDVGTSLLFSDGEMVSLNLLGTEIWKLCDGRSVDGVISALQEQFDVETDILRVDVTSFLNELARKGFVRYE